MTSVKQFEDLKVWQEARTLCQRIWAVSQRPSLSHEYRLRNQMTSASGSIMDNIAEGFERNGDKEFKQFCSIAKGSCGETKSQLYRCWDANFITQEEFNELYQLADRISRRLGKLIDYLKNPTIQEVNFQSPKKPTWPSTTLDMRLWTLNFKF